MQKGGGQLGASSGTQNSLNNNKNNNKKKEKPTNKSHRLSEPLKAVPASLALLEKTHAKVMASGRENRNFIGNSRKH